MDQSASDHVAVEVRGLEESYGDLQAVCGIDLETARRVFARAQRRRQDDDGGDPRGLPAARQRPRRSARHRPRSTASPAEAARASCSSRPALTATSLWPRRLRCTQASIRPPDRSTRSSRSSGWRRSGTPAVLKLSGGQQRRLDVAIALAGDPDLLFLDEPTTGFDPSARREAWEVVKNLAGLGKTVPLTTHDMDEAQYLADRVAVSRRAIVATGPPSTLAGRDGARARVRLRLPEGTELPAELAATERATA